MSGKIFLNYRRGDDPGNTGRLFDQLADAFPRDRLFMDVDSIPPGRDFVQVLEEQVAQCDVLLAVIGREWLNARDARGVRRLDQPDDFVRIEIASALEQNKLVIPVLVDNARMPTANELPHAIKPLATRNAVRLTHERFKSDTQGLIKAIQLALDEAASPEAVARRAQAEADRKARAQVEAARRAEAEAARKVRAQVDRRQRWISVGLILGLILVAVAGAWLLPRLLFPDLSIRTFTGHSKDVTAVAFSPDGRTALSGGLDAVKLWDVATGKVLWTSTGPVSGLDEVETVAFSPDGRTALLGTRSSSLKLWEVATSKELQTFQSYRSPAVFSRDGRTILSGKDARGYRSSDVELWDVATGRRLRSFSSHTSGVTSLAFSPDGRTALSGSWDKTLKLWDVATGRELRTFTGHSESVHGVAFSPDGRTVLSGSWDKTMKLWEVASGKELRTFTEGTGVNSVAFSPDGRTSLSVGNFHSWIRVWDVATGKALRTLTGHSRQVDGFAVSPDGRTALSGSKDTTLKLWDLAGL